jgi:hypothetical protein
LQCWYPENFSFLISPIIFIKMPKMALLKKIIKIEFVTHNLPDPWPRLGLLYFYWKVMLHLLSFLQFIFPLNFKIYFSKRQLSHLQTYTGGNKYMTRLPNFHILFFWKIRKRKWLRYQQCKFFNFDIIISKVFIF